MPGDGKNSRVPTLTRLHHVSVPTRDPLASSDWFERVLGFATLLIEEHENDVMAMLLQHPCGARLLVRRAEAPLAALRGYPLFALGVAGYTGAVHWEEHLTTVDAEHSAVHPAHLGWAVTVTGPDLILSSSARTTVPAAKTSRCSSRTADMGAPVKDGPATSAVVVAGDLLPRYATTCRTVGSIGNVASEG